MQGERARELRLELDEMQAGDMLQVKRGYIDETTFPLFVALFEEVHMEADKFVFLHYHPSRSFFLTTLLEHLETF